MKDRLVKHVKEFLGRHLVSEGGPIVLGFSGGGDSLALLHLLLEAGYGNALHLAHVDHGWREESEGEAMQLASLAKTLDLPFHLHKLQKQEGGNLEAKAREGRLEFFSGLYRELNAQALLLAHHADDQAETVFKRVLEGAHFLALRGMQESTTLEGMRLLRPLLPFHKKQLVGWLQKRGLQGFDDASNYDPAFLRARLRTEILPSLAERFGKEIATNLVRLGKTMEQVGEMMEGEVAKTLATVQKGSHGLSLEIPESFPRLLRSSVVKRFLAQEEFFLSYESLEGLCELLEARASGPSFLSKGKKLVIKSGKIFLIKN